MSHLLSSIDKQMVLVINFYIGVKSRTAEMPYSDFPAVHVIYLCSATDLQLQFYSPIVFIYFLGGGRGAEWGTLLMKTNFFQVHRGAKSLWYFIAHFGV